MTIRRTLAAALAASAIAAPAAAAQPADMHASTAQAAAQAQQRQDLRGEHAQDAALHPRTAQAVNAPGATVVDSQSKSTPVAPGQPTWAVNPKPLPPVTAQASTKSDDGVDWTTIGARHRHLAARDRRHRRPDEPQQGPAAHARQHLTARTQRTQRAPASSAGAPRVALPPSPSGAHTMTIRRTLAAALAATAIAAPPTAAQPATCTPDRDRGRQGAAAPGPARGAGEGRRTAPRKTQCACSRVARPSQRVRERDTAPAGDRAGHHGDDGVDWTTTGSAVAGTLLAVGGIAARSNRSRRRRTPASASDPPLRGQSWRPPSMAASASRRADRDRRKPGGLGRARLR